MPSRPPLPPRCLPPALGLIVWAMLPARPSNAAPGLARFQVDVPWSTAGVTALAIALDGALWAAGQTGLMRFDGRDVVTHEGRNSPALNGAGQISRVAIDPQGAVWVGTGAGFPYADSDGRLRLEARPNPAGAR